MGGSSSASSIVSMRSVVTATSESPSLLGDTASLSAVSMVALSTFNDESAVNASNLDITEQPLSDNAISSRLIKRCEAAVKAALLNAVTKGNLIFSFECTLGAEVEFRYCYENG